MAWILLLLLFPLALVVAIEMAVFSVRAERLESAQASGDRRATIILGYLANPPLFLSCIQIYSTALSLAIGVLSTPYVAVPITKTAQTWGISLSQANTVGTLLSLTLVTTLTLMFANLLPKQWGFAHAEGVVLRTARLSAIMLGLVRPLAAALEWLTKQMAKPLKIAMTSQSPVTESDIAILMRYGQQSGDLDVRESAIIERAFRLSDIRLTHVMTPRDQVEWINLESPIETLRHQLNKTPRSLLPVARHGLDNCVGVLKVRDGVALKDDFEVADLVPLLGEPLRVPQTGSLLELMEQLGQSSGRLALVCDEFGHVLGLVTLNDAVKALIGPLRALS